MFGIPFFFPFFLVRNHGRLVEFAHIPGNRVAYCFSFLWLTHTPHIPSHSSLNKLVCPMSSRVLKSTSSNGRKERCKYNLSFVPRRPLRIILSISTASSHDTVSFIFIVIRTSNAGRFLRLRVTLLCHPINAILPGHMLINQRPAVGNPTFPIGFHPHNFIG